MSGSEGEDEGKDNGDDQEEDPKEEDEEEWQKFQQDFKKENQIEAKSKKTFEVHSPYFPVVSVFCELIEMYTGYIDTFLSPSSIIITSVCCTWSLSLLLVMIPILYSNPYQTIEI
jgi:hypothetical protein